MKIGNKRVKKNSRRKIRSLDYKDFLKIYNYCTKEPYSFTTIDTRPNATMTFKKNFNEPLINNI